MRLWMQIDSQLIPQFDDVDSKWTVKTRESYQKRQTQRADVCCENLRPLIWQSSNSAFTQCQCLLPSCICEWQRFLLLKNKNVINLPQKFVNCTETHRYILSGCSWTQPVFLIPEPSAHLSKTRVVFSCCFTVCAVSVWVWHCRLVMFAEFARG